MDAIREIDVKRLAAAVSPDLQLERHSGGLWLYLECDGTRIRLVASGTRREIYIFLQGMSEARAVRYDNH
jgi:hypothetical protein